LTQKLRDLEWGKDQEIKALNKQVVKLRQEEGQQKISSIQDIESIKEDVTQRF
jgi:hypothetical protein